MIRNGGSQITWILSGLINNIWKYVIHKSIRMASYAGWL